MTAITLQSQQSNNGSFAALLADATELGEQAGLGKDTQIKFYLKVFEAAFHGKVDLDTSKHGTDIDDATKLTEAYVKAQNSAVVFNAKSPNQRKAISCVRTCIKGGMWSKGGSDEPLQSVNDLMAARQKLRADPANAKKLDDAANTLLKYLRLQTRRDQLIPSVERNAMCFKKQSKLASVEDILAGIRKAAQLLLDGKAAHGTVQDTSDEVLAIKNACTKRLADIAVAKGGGKHPASNGVSLPNHAPTP